MLSASCVQRGKVVVKGDDIWTLNNDQLADFRLNTVGFVFQTTICSATDHSRECRDPVDPEAARLE